MSDDAEKVTTQPPQQQAEGMTFWDHLDELRSRLLRCLALTAVLGVVAFALLLGVEPFVVGLMNTGLTEQFMIHLKVALYAGLLVASPYVLYQVFAFVSPALYEKERHYAVQIVGSAYVMFAIGTLLNYLLIFPLTVRFLGTYQVSPDVANMLTLQSYIDTLITMSLVMGLVFELPVVCWILGRMGLLNRSKMREYRRHAVIAILIVAAIITPTTDAFTLLIVALPIWLLYELSILLVKS